MARWLLSINRTLYLQMTSLSSISAGLLVSSIGFRGRPLVDGVPFDTRSGVVPNVWIVVSMAASEDFGAALNVGLD